MNRRLRSFPLTCSQKPRILLGQRYSLAMLKTCNVCNSNELETVWELPDFPLTGIYVENPQDVSYDNEYRQELQFCQNCSHAQLGNQINPTFLYRDTYTHRTSESPISADGNRYLLEYIRSVTGNREFNQVLEIGCNDLFLLDNLKDRSRNQAGVDPIWSDGVNVSEAGVRLWGGFAESVDYDTLLHTKADLVITAHTFEHITNPRLAIESLNGHLSEDCLFIVEVPSAERMLEQGRLDQVFNQHVNYYSVTSVEKLLSPLGFRLIDMDYNFSYWGGTQLLTFSRADQANHPIPKRQINRETYLQGVTTFLASMKNTSKQIENSRGPVYLYGAAQMLPSLIYHFSVEAREKIAGIIDDNPMRQNRYFPNLKTKIISSHDLPDLSDATLVISALDSARPILSRLLGQRIRTLIIPNGLI